MILDVCMNFVDIQTLFTAFYCSILEPPNLSISHGGTSLALSDVGFHFVFHGNAGIFKKGFQMTCGSFMIFPGDHPCAMGFQIACYQNGELDPQQRLANVLIFSSSNYWGYWGYNLQQLLERDVQNPQNETCCHLDCLFTPSARWLAVRCPTCRLGEHLQSWFLDDNYYRWIDHDKYSTI